MPTVDCAVSPRDQLGRFYCDSLVHDPDALRLVVKVFGAYGPHGWCGVALLSRAPTWHPPLLPLCLGIRGVFWGTPGEDKVCLGTDYPFPLGEFTAESRGKDYAPAHLIDSMEWDAGVKDKLLSLNACNWLGLTPEHFL
jgi:aminocarboxymuconate-semialdehyde decarboxylase